MADGYDGYIVGVGVVGYGSSFGGVRSCGGADGVDEVGDVARFGFGVEGCELLGTPLVSGVASYYV